MGCNVVELGYLRPRRGILESDGILAKDTEKNAEMQAIKPLIISPTILGASREIQCFLQIRTFGDGQ
jgi:hypothetical protein